MKGRCRKASHHCSLGNPIYLYNDVGLVSGKDKRLSVTWSVTRVVGMLTLLPVSTRRIESQTDERERESDLKVQKKKRERAKVKIVMGVRRK